MSPVKIILLGAAAYLAFKSGKRSADSIIEDLNKKIDIAIAENVEIEQKMEDLKNQYEGDLKGRITAYMKGYISRIGYAGDYWNSIFEVTIKNISSQPISISAVRVFWSCEGRKSTMVPWTNSAYTIQPEQSTTIILYGFNNKNHFAAVTDIQLLENLFKSEGKDPTDSKIYKKKPPIYCEMDIVQSANGKNFVRSFKGFSGTLVAYTDGRIFNPYKWENGTDPVVAKMFEEKTDE